jgi:uncharacterized membrane protein YgaE (UPF0421/DUF939 family)
MSPSAVPESHETPVRLALFHGVGAALVAVFSYVTASRFHWVQEPYWAAIAAVVSLYPDRNATMKAGAQQFFGSAVGSMVGWASASWWHDDVLLYGAAVLVAVTLCYLLRCPTAARLAAVAVTIITVIPMAGTPAVRALHRFLLVSYGVACAIGYTAAVGWIVGLRRRLRPR